MCEIKNEKRDKRERIEICNEWCDLVTWFSVVWSFWNTSMCADENINSELQKQVVKYKNS